jgi:hypothetical protein
MYVNKLYITYFNYIILVKLQYIKIYITYFLESNEGPRHEIYLFILSIYKSCD